MPEKMSFGEIRRDILDNKKAVKKVHERKEPYNMYDSELRSFGHTFSGTLPMPYVQELYRSGGEIEEYGEAFRNYIIDTLSKSPNKRHTAVEFGGPGSNLFAAFSNEFLNKTVGVCLEDLRSKRYKEEDEKYGHSVLVGDFIDGENEKLYGEIKQNLKADKTDLIICRMGLPLEDIAKNPLIMDRIIRKWYSMLNENGLIFAQFEFFQPVYIRGRALKPPTDAGTEFKPESQQDTEVWAEAIKKRFPEIEIEIVRGAMRLHKKIGAPKDLPSLKELGL